MILAILLASVITFGAVGDGVHDDTRAIQAALDSGDAVFMPSGRYRVSRAGYSYCSLNVRGDVAGDGEAATVIVQADGTAPSVRTLCVTGDSPSLADFTLEGGAQSPDEHRAGIFAHDVTGLEMARVTARGFSGDGAYLYSNTVATTLTDVTLSANGRNGLTMGATVTGVDILRLHAVGNRAQQVDSEPGGDAVVSDVTIIDSDLDGAGVSTDFALTVSGAGSSVPGRGWTVTGNRLGGGIFVVNATDVLVGWNVIRSAGAKPSVTVERASSAVRVTGNDLEAPVYVIGTLGSGPSDVLVTGNRVAGVDAYGYSLRALGAVTVEAVGNELAGAIQLRATVLERPFARAVVAHNRAGGLSVNGNGAARLLCAEVMRNTFATPPSFDDGTHALVALVTDVKSFAFGGIVQTVACP